MRPLSQKCLNLPPFYNQFKPTRFTCVNKAREQGRLFLLASARAQSRLFLLAAARAQSRPYLEVFSQLLLRPSCIAAACVLGRLSLLGICRFTQSRMYFSLEEIPERRRPSLSLPCKSSPCSEPPVPTL